MEEVEPALMRLMEGLSELTAGPRPLRLTTFYHSPERGDVQVWRLDPVGHGPEVKRRFAVPPVLNLQPRVLLTELVEHYLDAHLHELIYASLMAENLRRLQHMDGAMRHIDDESGRLRMRSNSLRQEEITEEIELILLTAESLLGSR